MTVSISATPAQKAAGPETATPPKDKGQKFGKLIDSADIGNGVVDAPCEPQAPPADASADQSLDALLAALKLTLAPGAVLLAPGTKKASEGDKAVAAKDEPAEDGEQPADPAAALLVALNLSSLPSPMVSKDLVSQTRQAVDDVLGKPAAARAPLAEAAPVPLPLLLPPGFDLSALADVASVKAPAAAAPATVQLERLLDTARDAAWLDRLSQDIAASAGAGDKMRFRMMPPNLGALDVSVERQAAGMSVSMTTHTTDARNLIADSRQQMVDSLKAQGVPLIQLSLSSAGEDLERHRPPTFFNHMIEAAPLSGTDLAAQSVESTTAERVGRFA